MLYISKPVTKIIILEKFRDGGSFSANDAFLDIFKKVEIFETTT